MDKGYYNLSTMKSGRSGGYTPVANSSYYDPSPNMAHDFHNKPSQGYSRSPSPYPPSVTKAQRQERYAGSYPRRQSNSSCGLCDWIMWLFILLLIAVGVYCHLHASSILSSADNCPSSCLQQCYSQYPRTLNGCDLASCDSQCNPQASQAKVYKLASIGTIVAGILTTLITLCIRFCSCGACYGDSCCVIIWWAISFAQLPLEVMTNVDILYTFIHLSCQHTVCSLAHVYFKECHNTTTLYTFVKQDSEHGLCCYFILFKYMFVWNQRLMIQENAQRQAKSNFDAFYSIL